MTHEKAPPVPIDLPGRQAIEKLPGKGGSRKGFVAKNEIEDMTLFDEDPGKLPPHEERKHAKKGKKGEEAIDPEAFR